MNERAQFLKYLQTERRYSLHTLKSYETDLSQFQLFCADQYEEDQLTAQNHLVIRSWMVSLKEQGCSSRTIHRKLSSLRSFFKYARKMGWTQENPVLKVPSPKLSKRLPAFVAEGSMENLLDHFSFPEGFTGERDELLVTLFYETGIRLSEMIELRDKDIDISACQIKVLGKRNKERVLPVSQETMSRIIHFQQRRKEEFGELDAANLLVTDKGRKLYPKFVYRKVNAYLSLVSTVQQKSPHILRHTFATHMLNNGANLNSVKELLGHASLAATQVYTHNTIDKLKRIHEQKHPRG